MPPEKDHARSGRKKAADNMDRAVFDLFDERKNSFTFRRGELSQVAREIADKTDYKPDTVEQKIRKLYREREKRQEPAN